MNDELNVNTNLDEKYQVKSEIDHVLDRPGTWVGSINSEIVDYLLYVPSTNRITLLKNQAYNAGLLKLVDEVLSNSVDEHRDKDALFRINEITVEIYKNGKIIIEDNGGITVTKHKQTGILIPELIFGHLRTSSNYDDSKERDKVGTNGLGAKLTNIFSKDFSVETCDGKNHVKIEWFDNMKEIKPYTITHNTRHFTRTEFQIDLERFDLEELNLSTIRIIQKRCIDASATNSHLKINFKSDIADGKLNSTWVFDSFKDYVKLFLEPAQIEHIMEFKSKKDDIIILPNVGFNFGFVNGAVCSKGSHIKKIEKQITDKILGLCADMDMELLTEKDILQRISVFINCSIVNPSYNSQTKEELNNKIDKYALNFSHEFLNSFKDSEILNQLKDYYLIKYAEEQKKETRKLNATIKTTKIKKLIINSGTNKNNSELWLFEGNSASNGFRKHRKIETQSAYLLRGKITNTFNLKKNQILENQELREVIATLGILFDDAKNNIKNCRYSKIVIASDMDFDGHHICGLLIAFFAKHFSELVKTNRLYRALSPIIIAAKKGKPKEYFYSLESYEKVAHNYKDWDLTYTKGLGGLDNEDYRQMLRNQKLILFSMKDLDDIESINTWFNKSTDQRKLIILEDSKELED